MPPTLPPVDPQQVEIYLPGNNPEEDYEPLSAIDITVEIDVENAELLTQAVEQAAALGADALIVDRLGPNTSGAVLPAGATEHIKRIIQARAVYYPARHPELLEGQS